MAAYQATAVNVAEGSRPERVHALAVTANMFDVLGVRPRIGRPFTPQQDLPNAEPVVVISDGLWRRSFGADPAIIGNQVEVQVRNE
jgi:hypothetical protein